MLSLLALLQNQISDVLQSLYGAELSQELCLADVNICPEEFGHYQCNSALRLSKLLKKNPRAIAESVVLCIKEDPKFEKIEIAGPGFINFTFASHFLSAQLNQQLQDPMLGAQKAKSFEKMIVEFSSPNVAKQLHVGHLRSTIIGDCLARLFEFLGFDVLRLNHIGDWGTQFGMLIAYMKADAKDVLSGEKKTDLEQLMFLYRSAKLRFDADPEFKKRSQLEVVSLQREDPESMQIWRLICDISRIGYQEIYDLLDVKIIERGESFYNPFLKDVVLDLEKKNLIEISDGAKCVFLEGFKNREGEPLPIMVQKSDGGFNYDTTDLAAIKYRIFEDKAKRIIYVTDLGQSLHFQMVFAAAEKALWLDPKKTQVDHVGFGLVLGLDGKKFKTRSGDTEKLIDLLTEAVEHAKRLLVERQVDMTPKDLLHLARVLGIGAVKYADLASSRTKDYTFSYERMLKFEGNTAVFLLYSYVRIQGIFRKCGVDPQLVGSTGEIILTHPSEVALGLHLRRFGEVLDLMAKELLPNRLTDYLYTLAEKFNAFFRDCRVEGVLEQNSRLILCRLTSQVLEKGLHILGLQTVDRM